MSGEPEFVWVAYGKDRAKLPIAVADTAAELARLVGTKRNNVESQASKLRRGILKESQYQRVRIAE